METRKAGSISQELRVTDREKWTLQRREQSKLIIGSLNGRKRIPNCFHFFPRVKRASADQQMRNPSRFERANIRPGDIGHKTAKPAKQQTNVARLNVDQLISVTALG